MERDEEKDIRRVEQQVWKGMKKEVEEWWRRVQKGMKVDVEEWWRMMEADWRMMGLIGG